MKRLKGKIRLMSLGLGLLAASLVSGCGPDEQFTQQATSQFFLQDFNPAFLDILWVIDDRSPMHRIREHVVAEGTNFFRRLDGATAQYRMGIISADTRFSEGRLKPEGNPAILTKSFGGVEDRAQIFAALLSQVINLRTGAESTGLGAMLLSLTEHFPTQRNVPLVLVFISDSDDSSDVPGGTTNPVAYFADELENLKDSRDLIRVYSINYRKLAAGESPSDENRCATRYNYNPLLDNPNSGFELRYNAFANAFGGDTADLCGSFASLMDLTGLRLKQLPRKFRLDVRPVPESLSVTVTRDNVPVAAPKWQYDPATNEIVFDAPPPEGTTIQVTYQTA